eukprot:6981517-Ditylum_brightwellii.AAC.1
MSVVSNPQKQFKMKDVESRRVNHQVPSTQKKSAYKFKEKKLHNVIKCKSVDMLEGVFGLVEVVLKGDALTCWQEFKHMETMCTSKNPDGIDMDQKGICLDTFKGRKIIFK